MEWEEEVERRERGREGGRDWKGGRERLEGRAKEKGRNIGRGTFIASYYSILISLSPPPLSSSSASSIFHNIHENDITL